MPKDLIGRRERCLEWITRPSPNVSPNQSDDEDNYHHLLGIASREMLFTENLDMVCGLEGGVDEDDNENEWD